MATDNGHRPQLVRMLQLILTLGSGRYPNARELAELAEVSRRTVFRDLEALERAGVPVRYRADRQGYGLASEFRFEPPALGFEEAAALILLARWGGAQLGPTLARAAESGLLKCLSGLPDEPGRQLRALLERVEAPPETPTLAPTREPIYLAILRALALRRQVRLHYREPGADGLVSTRFTPYRLLLDGQVWCLLGRSSLHRNVRRVRLPWVHRVEPTDDPATVPPRFRASPRRTRVVHLRLAAELAAKVLEQPWSPAQRIDPLPDGRFDLHLVCRDLRALRRRILALGALVEVLAPASLRGSIRRTARRVARLHARTAESPPDWTVDSRGLVR